MCRESLVPLLWSMGWEVANIATEMGLSPHTVRNHSTNLRRKLDVRSSLGAVMAAVRLGVLKFDEGRRVVSLTGSWRPRKVASLYQQALPGHVARLRARHSVVAHRASSRRFAYGSAGLASCYLRSRGRFHNSRPLTCERSHKCNAI